MPGTLLRGKVRYGQYEAGFRTGIEPVLLAACVPARDGERVIEAGSGAGAGLLCLAARVAGVTGFGIERDSALVDLAQRNAATNGWSERLIFSIGAIEDGVTARGPFDHAIANPPWHDPAGTASPDAARAGAKQVGAVTVDRWIGALARVLRPGGTLSLVLATANLDAAMAAMAAHRCGSARILPLWPRAGRAAKILLLQAVRGGRGATRLLPGLVLHGPDGYTDAARRILDDGAALPL